MKSYVGFFSITSTCSLKSGPTALIWWGSRPVTLRPSGHNINIRLLILTLSAHTQWHTGSIYFCVSKYEFLQWLSHTHLWRIVMSHNKKLVFSDFLIEYKDHAYVQFHFCFSPSYIVKNTISFTTRPIFHKSGTLLSGLLLVYCYISYYLPLVVSVLYLT